jgi:cyclopropane fatty-acyl-phospholipid synthase-like methyltransferase
LTKWAAKTVGYFAFQTNNTTRQFEYPWAFDALQVRPGLRILEIGGGLAGLQFVLDRAGCDVVNVDPGDGLFNPSWPPTTATMVRLNKLFGTNVTMLNCFLHEARFPDESFDRVVSISVFEHIPPEILSGILSEVRRVLKPGGLLVMTVDLFLDVQPFCRCRIESLWTQRLGQMDC